MSDTEAIFKAVKQGLALVVYQDDKGVHIGVIDNEAILEARARTIEEEEVEEVVWSKDDERQEGDLYHCQGWLDTEGGDIEKLDSIAMFGPPWKTLCEVLVDDD